MRVRTHTQTDIRTPRQADPLIQLFWVGPEEFAFSASSPPILETGLLQTTLWEHSQLPCSSPDRRSSTEGLALMVPLDTSKEAEAPGPFAARATLSRGLLVWTLHFTHAWTQDAQRAAIFHWDFYLVAVSLHFQLLNCAQCQQSACQDPCGLGPHWHTDPPVCSDWHALECCIWPVRCLCIGAHWFLKELHGKFLDRKGLGCLNMHPDPKYHCHQIMCGCSPHLSHCLILASLRLPQNGYEWATSRQACG